MRRAGPILIIVIGVLAILVDFVRVPLPSLGGQDAGTTRYLETKLGLDLQGGLRIEYQVLPAEGKAPSRDDLAVMRQIIINRVDKSGVAEPQVVGPGQRPDRRRDAGHPERGPDPEPRRHHRPPRLRPARARPARRGPELPAAVLATTCSDDRHRDVHPVLRRPDRRRVDRREPDRPAHRQLHAQRPRARTCSRHYTADAHRRLSSRSCSTARSSPRRSSTSSIPGGQVQISRAAIGGYPLADAQNLVTILQFGQLPFPIAGAREHDCQPDARRGVPAPEPARRR